MKPLSRTVGENRVVDELIVTLPMIAKCGSIFREWHQPVGRWSYRMQVHQRRPLLRAAKVISLQEFPRT